jgi:hypothetical protein
MYGTVARYRIKPGMKEHLLALEAEFREAKVPGLVVEFIYSMDDDPLVCYEAVVFESKEAYRALADSPDQDVRYRKLLEYLEGPPEWHDGEVINSTFGG